MTQCPPGPPDRVDKVIGVTSYLSHLTVTLLIALNFYHFHEQTEIQQVVNRWWPLSISLSYLSHQNAKVPVAT